MSPLSSSRQKTAKVYSIAESNKASHTEVIQISQVKGSSGLRITNLGFGFEVPRAFLHVISSRNATVANSCVIGNGETRRRSASPKEESDSDILEKLGRTESAACRDLYRT